MIKYVFLLFIFVSSIFANTLKSPIIGVDDSLNEATIKIEMVNVGMSGFIIHSLAEGHSTVLKEIVVTKYDEKNKIATLKMSDFVLLKHNSLPKGQWHVEVGDTALLAFGYSRALLIAPNEEIFHRTTKASEGIQWVHPDIFAAILSINGHPSPQKKDFDEMSNSASVGVLFFFINKKLFTVDSKTFKLLNISDAPLKDDDKQLPFYSRVLEIDKAWWGAGSSPIKEYEPYYYELLLKFNEENKELHKLYEEFKNKK
ncbi:MAG: plasminogen-binding N-terminal domain-containing protein [Campylobacterales bacterium]|nr:plasminogen-binding N-terminal domain-containing protein [Campylobacterales bacterium]